MKRKPTVRFLAKRIAFLLSLGALFFGVLGMQSSPSVGLAVHTMADDNIAAYNSFSTWLGRPVMYRVTFCGMDSWNSIANPWFINAATTWVNANPNHWEVISVPMLPQGDTGNFAAITNGSRDTYWQTLANNIKNAGIRSRTIIRLGWEFNGNWFPWSAVTNPTGYRNSYQHIVTVMRAIIPELKFDWCANRSSSGGNWKDAYPGDASVDMISMDVYDQYDNFGTWANLVGNGNGDAGLQDLRNFAAAHNKPEAYPEWSCSLNSGSNQGGGDNPTFVQNMFNWFNAAPHGVVYQGYWDTNDGGPSAAIYSNGTANHVPNTAAKYKQLFGTTTPPSGQADLVVTDVTWTPATPTVGNAVTFKATVKNQGTLATPAGTILGVAFHVDGTKISWSDTYTTSLAPGASVTLTANGGPTGSSTWTATAGNHTIMAFVDDVNRITESNEGNNQRSVSLTVGNLSKAINCGGGAASPYIADTGFSGGSTFSDTSTSINVTGVTNPAPQAVYQTCRWATSFNYTVSGLTAGASYQVRLHFAELTWTAAGQRKFNVAINGTNILTAFDIFAAAGAQKKAVVRQFTATANASGQITIAFSQGGADNPEINGIEVM